MNTELKEGEMDPHLATDPLACIIGLTLHKRLSIFTLELEEMLTLGPLDLLIVSGQLTPLICGPFHTLYF